VEAALVAHCAVFEEQCGFIKFGRTHAPAHTLSRRKANGEQRKSITAKPEEEKEY